MNLFFYIFYLIFLSYFSLAKNLDSFFDVFDFRNNYPPVKFIRKNYKGYKYNNNNITNILDNNNDNENEFNFNFNKKNKKITDDIIDIGALGINK